MNKKPSFTKLPDDVQKEIREKYMEGYSAAYLAKEYDLVRQSLGWYIRKHGWDEERRLQRADLFQRFSDSKKAAFTGIYLSGTELMKRAVEDAMKEYRNGNLSIKDKLLVAKQISEVIKELDKIQRLDDGQPTEIKEDRPFSIEDVERKLRIDPFYKEKVEDASFKEVEQANND